LRFASVELLPAVAGLNCWVVSVPTYDTVGATMMSRWLASVTGLSAVPLTYTLAQPSLSV
jgi:hypothetical protein